MIDIKEIDSSDAYEALKNNDSVLVDVRTDAEHIFVGQVDLSKISGKVILLPWKTFPAMAINPRFQITLEKELNGLATGDIRDLKLIFMCRSGARSLEAAMYCTQLGFKNCYNLISGFEGRSNDKGHRSTIDGWKAENLPWKQ